MPLAVQDEQPQLIALRDRIVGLMTFNLILIELLACFFSIVKAFWKMVVA